MSKLPLRCFRPIRSNGRTFSTSRKVAADHVRIVEVGPRDGLQNEKSTISLDTKLELIRRLAQTGVTHMEAGSFVPAKWVPQVGSDARQDRFTLTDADGFDCRNPRKYPHKPTICTARHRL